MFEQFAAATITLGEIIFTVRRQSVFAVVSILDVQTILLKPQVFLARLRDTVRHSTIDIL